jgi:hypothetical protein
MKPPYLISLALQAFTESPRKWQETLRTVRQRNIKSLPQTSVGLLQPALAKVLDRNMSFKSKTSDELFEEIRRRTNEYFGASLLQSKEDSMKMLLRLGCVLLRMQKLDKDPTISKVIYDTGCIKSDLFIKNVSQLSKNNIASLQKKLRNANKTFSGALVDDKIVEQIGLIFQQIPASKIQIVQDLAKTLFSSIVYIYDQEHSKWASTKSTKIPTEFLLLLAEKNYAFNSTAFVNFTKKISKKSLKSLKIENLQSISTKAYENENSYKMNKIQTFREYSKIIHHAQSVISFYQKFNSPSGENLKLINSLKKMFAALKIFQDKAPKNMNVISSGTFEMSSLLQTNPFGKNMTERFLFSQMYDKKLKTFSNKLMTNQLPTNPFKPANKPPNKPANKPPNKPAGKPAGKPQSPDTVLAPLLG